MWPATVLEVVKQGFFVEFLIGIVNQWSAFDEQAGDTRVRDLERVFGIGAASGDSGGCAQHRKGRSVVSAGYAVWKTDVSADDIGGAVWLVL